MKNNQIEKTLHKLLITAHIGPKKKISQENPRGVISINLSLDFLKIQNIFDIYTESPSVPFVEGTSSDLFLSIETASLKALAKPLKQDSII